MLGSYPPVCIDCIIWNKIQSTKPMKLVPISICMPKSNHALISSSVGR